jgi:selenide,water dikinase
MGADALAHVLRPLSSIFGEVNPDLLVGLGAADDAAVYRLNDAQAIVATADFFPPIVDDPTTFGAIAAANALSDIYAMGGTPLFALNLVAFPDDLDREILTEILRGGAEKVREAGAVIAGGHTISDAEPKYGLAAIGVVHPQRIFTKGGVREGDALILTKPLGTGVISTAQKNGVDEDAFAARLSAAVASMTTLNAAAARALGSLGADLRACTDITGFGLLGHALEMATLSGCALRFDLPSIPWLAGARDYAEAGYIPGGTGRNEQAVAAQTSYGEGVTDLDRALLCDPQTSGGLLAAIAPERLDATLAALSEAGVAASVIGHAQAGVGLIVSASPPERPRARRPSAHASKASAPEAPARPFVSGAGATGEAVDAGGTLAALEETLGHTFANRQLLLDALTHRSYAYEFAAPGVVSNERLEFLGDAVLALVSADQLYQQRPEAQEGDLTQLRAALVRASTLADFARRIPLGPYLRLGRGEEATGGRDRETLIASAFEAVIGALYLDAGLGAAQDYLLPLLRAEAANAVQQRRVKDDKSLLQELAQGQLSVTPRYVVVNQEGPSHDRIFSVEALVGEVVIGRGQGHSKREAEQAAAHAALQDPGWTAPDQPELPEQA